VSFFHHLTIGLLDRREVDRRRLVGDHASSAEPLEIGGEPVELTEGSLRCVWYQLGNVNEALVRLAIEAIDQCGCTVADIEHARTVGFAELQGSIDRNVAQLSYPELSVFIDADISFDTLVDLVESICGAVAERDVDIFGARAELAPLEIRLTARPSEGYIDNLGIPFSRYPNQIRVEATRPRAGESVELARAASRQLARRLSEHFACEARVVGAMEETVALYARATGDSNSALR
jgi:hypothetical protein